MPRTGDNYDYPAGTLGISGQTIFSARYNAWVEDIKSTLNLPLPISKGGTGASNISGTAGARDNLNVPAIEQKITNWATMELSPGIPAEQGFVWSDTATGQNAPFDGHPFAGVYYWGDVPTPPAGPQNAVVIVQDLDSTVIPAGISYMKTKRGGAWSAWTIQGSGQFVLKAGDTMTGDLAIDKANAQVTLRKPASGSGSAISGYTAATARWLMYLGDSVAETGSNTGSNFTIARFNDAGTILDSAFNINRANGVATFNAPVVVASMGNITLGGNAATGIYADGTGIALRAFGSNSIYLQSANGAANYGTFGTAGLAMNSLAISAVSSITMNGPLNVQQSTLAVGSSAVNIGYNVPNGILLRPSSDTASPLVFLNAANSLVVGTISTTGTTTAYNTSSDGRLKEDLKSFDAGVIIDDTNVYDFAWRSTGERAYGVIGQQAIEVYPAAVTHVEDKEQDWYGVDYSKYVPVILQELKALRTRVAELEGALVAGTQQALEGMKR